MPLLEKTESQFRNKEKASKVKNNFSKKENQKILIVTIKISA